jgi:uncharacterized protein involved in exopolysaccharide biosynthesis
MIERTSADAVRGDRFGWRAVSGLVRNLDVIGLVTVAALAAAAAFVLVRPTEFVAQSLLVPESRNVASRLGALVTQLGGGSGAALGDETPAYYQRLILSHDVLGAAARERVARPGSEDVLLPMIELLAGGRSTIDDTSAVMRRHVRVTTDWNAGVVAVHTSASSPVVATLLNHTVLANADMHNSTLRRGAARAEREFVEGRYREAHAELLEAEQDAERFLAANREFRGAPSLTFEAARLQRRAESRQLVANMLAESLERARLEEVRSTPLLRIVEQPNARRRGGNVVIALFAVTFGFMSGCAVAYLREQIRAHSQVGSEEWKDFNGSLRTGMHRLRMFRIRDAASRGQKVRR